MRYQVRESDGRYDFEVTGASFIGAPRDGTVLFVTRKVGGLLRNLEGHARCLVFAEEGLEVPEALREQNCFRLCPDAEAAYADFMLARRAEDSALQAGRKYTLTPAGFWLGENVTLGEGARIEPGCLIDHDVVLGRNARIGFGSRISQAVIGDDFRCDSHAVVGTDAWYPVGEGNRRLQLPSFGRVRVGNRVVIGCQTVIERGVNADTVIDDYAQMDAQVCVGHDCEIGHHVRICCGVRLGGLVKVGPETYIGMGATVKQRLQIGAGAMVGMGSVVVSRVGAGEKVFGSPARKMML